MSTHLVFGLCLAAFWGCVWAWALQATGWGRWLALRRTWITVVVGVGGDMAVLLLVLPWDLWLAVLGVLAASSVGIILRSLLNEWHEER